MLESLKEKESVHMANRATGVARFDFQEQEALAVQWRAPLLGIWSYVLSAALRSLAVIALALLGSRVASGSSLYLGLVFACVLLFMLPAYRNALQLQALRRLSLRDPLTGIGNRRTLWSRLREEVARCARGRYSVAVLMIDVDKLKQINDEQGHRAGDEALRLVARVLRRSVRISDVVGRLGGDEFLVIAPQTSAEVAFSLGERISSSIHRDSLMRIGTPHVSLSIGVATAGSTKSDLRELLETADRAMYEAKRMGGGRVVQGSKTAMTEAAPTRQMASVPVSMEIASDANYRSHS